MSNDIIETDVHGQYWTVKLSCGHTYEFYNGKHEGSRMIKPIIESLIQLVPNGVKANLRDGFHNGLQDLIDNHVAIDGIFCPDCTFDVPFDKEAKPIFRQIAELSIDTHYSQWSGRHTSVPFWTTKHHGTFIGDKQIR